MAIGDNANDTYTETETISYGSRISSSFKGMIPGILMFLGAFPLLFWNEGRAVKTARALDEGQGVVIEVPSNKTVDGENDGKLVYMTGKADTAEILQDATFGAFRLNERQIERIGDDRAYVLPESFTSRANALNTRDVQGLPGLSGRRQVRQAQVLRRWRWKLLGWSSRGIRGN